MSCIILVAEDDVLVRNTARLALQEQGHTVLVAPDGYAALELSRDYQGTIDLLVTAARLPRLDGAALVAQISKERPSIKILVLVGSSDEFTEYPFVRKPFSPKTLREKVRNIMETPS